MAIDWSINQGSLAKLSKCLTTNSEEAMPLTKQGRIGLSNRSKLLLEESVKGKEQTTNGSSSEMMRVKILCECQGKTINS